MVKLKKLLEEKSYEITNLNRKLESRGELIAMLIFLFFASIFILPNMFENVNESEFCLKKMETYFPEYDWYKVINGTKETRDGLEEVTKTESKTKRFKLLNYKEIDYLESDNWHNVGLVFGMFLFIISFLMLLCWYEVIG